MIRLALAGLFVVGCISGCISKAKEAVAPTPDGSGTLTCREIVEQCDSQCRDPLYLSRCSNEGNADGAAQHGALLECGQRNGCTDQDCMQANCPTEITACMGEPATDPAAAPTSEPAATETPPSS